MSALRDKIIATITQASQRDKQRKIGPSSLGEQCERCLAEEMLGNGGKRPFSLYAWLGTAVHKWLEEHEKDPTVLTEQKTSVGIIEGYGVLTGTSDRYDIDLKAVVDYKVVSKKRIAQFKKGYYEHNDGRVEFFDNDVLKYYIQINAYGFGMVNQGYPVDTVALCLIPRDAATHRDIAVIEFPYNPDIVLESLPRAAQIYEYATEHGTEDLEHHPECWELKLGRA